MSEMDDFLDDLFESETNEVKDDRIKIMASLISEDDGEDDDFEIPESSTKKKQEEKPEKKLIGVSPRKDLGEEADTSYRVTQDTKVEVEEDSDDDILDDLDDILGGTKVPDFGVDKSTAEEPSAMKHFDDVEKEDDLDDEFEIVDNEEDEGEIEDTVEVVVEMSDDEEEDVEETPIVETRKESPKEPNTLLEKLLSKNLIDDPEYLSDPNLKRFYKIKLDAAKFFNLNEEKVDYIACMKEVTKILSEVTIKHDAAIHLDKFNELLQMLQSHRNRVAELKAWAISDYFLKKKYIKDLENYLTSCSNKKSKEQREGDQLEHMRDLKEEFILSERFYHHVDWGFEALTAAHESLSRRVTIEQEKNKRISRGEEPYVQSVTDVEEFLPRKTPLFKQEFEKKENSQGWKAWDQVD